MAILGSTDLGGKGLVLYIDHDPFVTPTDAPDGSLLIRVDLGATPPITGEWYRKRSDGSNTDVTSIAEALDFSISTGYESGGDLTRNATPLDLDVAAGRGLFVISELARFVNWTAQTVTVPANVSRLVVVDNTGTVQLVDSDTLIVETQVVLGTVVTDATDIIAVIAHRVVVSQLAGLLHTYFREAIGPTVVSGLLTSINGGDALRLDVDEGVFFVTEFRADVPATAPIAFNYYYRDGVGGFTIVASQTQIDSNNYDDGSGTLATLPLGSWKKDLLLVSNGADGVEYHIVYGQKLFGSQASAELGDQPAIPPYLRDFSARSTGVVIEGTSTSIAVVVDHRTLIGQRELDRVTPPAAIKTVFFRPQAAATTAGNRRFLSIAANGSDRFMFSVPNDFNLLVSLELIVVPSAAAANPANDIDLSSDYGVVDNETPANHSETDTTITFDWTGRSGLFTPMDISSVFSVLAAGDICGIVVNHNAIGGSADYYGVRLRYN